MSILALDIGGTAVKHGFFNGKAVFGEFPVKEPDGTEKLPERIIDFISEFSPDCIGLCAPGPFDFNTGTSIMEHKLNSLYKISLRTLIEEKFPNRSVFFIHDATAFILGAIYNNFPLANQNIAGVMLGTGLGYVHCIDGRVEINEGKTPLKPLWNRPYIDGIAENYVSATAIINKANSKGYAFKGVREIAVDARKGDEILLEIFLETGAQLGDLLNFKQKEDDFEKILIGGQVSKAWDLMRKGFEYVCNIPYQLISEPAKCSLFGIKYCAENGVGNIYI